MEHELLYVERAMGRAASVAHEDLKRGLNILATITSIAPFAGVLGTVLALNVETFYAISGEKTADMAKLAERISHACVPTAVGLVIGLQALWTYRYLRGRLAGFDREMADARLSLVNQLAIHFGRLRPANSIEGVSHSVPYLEAYAPASWKYEPRTALAALALVFVAWCVQVVAYLALDFVPLNSAMIAGVLAVVLKFCFSLPLAHAVWVNLLHRKTAWVVLIAAALCLSWCAARLFFPAI